MMDTIRNGQELDVKKVSIDGGRVRNTCHINDGGAGTISIPTEAERKRAWRAFNKKYHLALLLLLAEWYCLP